MTILRTIDGQEIDDSQFKGYGKFTEYIRENFDKYYGKGLKDGKKWKVKLVAKKTSTVYTEIEIEATTKKSAEKEAIIEAKKLTEFDWNDYDESEIEDISIEDSERMAE